MSRRASALRHCGLDETGDADQAKTPGDNKNQHDCDHCRGFQALIAQKASDHSKALKLLDAIESPIQTTTIASEECELPSITDFFTLERPPPDLFVWHCALLN